MSISESEDNAMEACIHERRPAELVCVIHGGSVLKKKLHHRRKAKSACSQEARALLVFVVSALRTRSKNLENLVSSLFKEENPNREHNHHAHWHHNQSGTNHTKT